MSLQTLKQRALDNPEVKAEYKQLEAEFNFINQHLPVQPELEISQNKLGKNKESKE